MVSDMNICKSKMMIAYIQFTKMEENNIKKSSKANRVQTGKWGRYDHICEKKIDWKYLSGPPLVLRWWGGWVSSGAGGPGLRARPITISCLLKSNSGFELHFFIDLSLLSDLRVCLYSWLLRMFCIRVCGLLYFQWNENKLCHFLTY